MARLTSLLSARFREVIGENTPRCKNPNVQNGNADTPPFVDRALGGGSLGAIYPYNEIDNQYRQNLVPYLEFWPPRGLGIAVLRKPINRLLSLLLLDVFKKSPLCLMLDLMMSWNG